MAANDENHWRNIAIVATTLDTIGLVGCLYMFVSIMAYRSYHTTKDRIILSLCVVTILFICAGNLPEKIHNLQYGYASPVPVWNLYTVYSTWWAVLMTECSLLLYSLYILVAISPGTILRTTVIKWQIEVAYIVILGLIACTAGGVSVYYVNRDCGNGDDAVYLDGLNDACNTAISTCNWVWIGFLVIPFLIQFMLWSKVVQAGSKIEAYHKMTEDGEPVNDPVLATAPALDRVIKSVVKPLQWYPLVFLMVSVLYVVWLLSLYSSQRQQTWARQAGPASSLVFAVKGIINSGVYIFSSDNHRRERGLLDQLRFRFRQSTESWNGTSAHENLVQEFSHHSSGPFSSSSLSMTSESFAQYADNHLTDTRLTDTVESTR